MLDGDGSLRGQLLDLGLPVLLPVGDVVVPAHAQRPAREDDGAHVVVEARRAHGFLVGLGRAGLFAEHETGADPDGASAQHQRRGERLAVEDATRGDYLDRLARHGTRLAGAETRDFRNEDGGGNVAGVAASFTTLGANQVYAQVEAFFNVLWVADHVHVQYTILR